MSYSEEKFYSGVGKVAAGTIVTAAVGIIFHPVLVRLLGTEQYGSLAVALAVFSVLSHIFLFGMRESTRKHLPQFSEKKSTVCSFTAGLLLIAGLIPVLMFFLLNSPGLLSSYFPGAEGLILLTLPALFSMNVYKGLRSMLYGLYMEGRGEVVTATGRLVYYVGAISLVLYGMGAEGVVYWVIVYPLLMAALVLKLIPDRVEISLEKFFEARKNVAGDMVSYGFLTLVSVLFMQLHLQADILFVNFFNGSADAGIYKGAVVVVNFIWLVPAALQKTLLHSYSDMSSNDEGNKVEEYTLKTLKLLVPLLALIAAGLTSLSGSFMQVYYGSGFYRGATALTILAVGAVFAGLAKALSSNIEASGGIRSSVKSIVAASIFNLVLNLSLVPVYGINGAAAATAVSYTVLFFLQERVFRNRRARNLYREIDWRGMLTSVVATVAVLEAGKLVIITPRLRLMLLPPLGVLVFVAVALRFSDFESKELEAVLKPVLPVKAERLFSLFRRLEG